MVADELKDVFLDVKRKVLMSQFKRLLHISSGHHFLSPHLVPFGFGT